MSALPLGWEETTIGEIARIETGATPPKSKAEYYGRDVCFYKPGDLDPGGVISLSEDMVSEAGAAAARLLPSNTLLVTCIGNLGKSALIERPSICNQQINAVLPTPAAEPRYLYYWSRTIRPWLEENSSATTVTIINKGRFSQAPIRLAPLPEQRRIVAKIDSLSTKSKRASGQLNEVSQLVRRYREAILAAAFRGDLTRQWRVDAGVDDLCAEHDELPKELCGTPIPIGWKVSSIANVADNHDGKRVPIRASDRALRRGKFPYYGASGVIDTIDDYLYEGEYLLIGEDGANLVNRSTPIAFLARGRFWVNNHAHVLNAKEGTSNEWICHFINMMDLVPYVTGTAQPKLTQAALNKIYIPIPPLEEQQVILRLIGAASSWVDRLQAEAAKASNLIGNLEKAILTKAFQGNLVPQDSNDVPASVILKRIKAEGTRNEVALSEKRPKQNDRPKARLVRSQKPSGKRPAGKSKT